MSLYYFHIRDERGLIEDAESIELPDIHAALQETLRSVKEFAQDTCAAEGAASSTPKSGGLNGSLGAPLDAMGRGA